jgi:hypothetical protein
LSTHLRLGLPSGLFPSGLLLLLLLLLLFVVICHVIFNPD